MGVCFSFSFRPTTSVRIHYVANGIGAWNVLAGRAPRRHRRHTSFLFLSSDSDFRTKKQKTKTKTNRQCIKCPSPVNQESDFVSPFLFLFFKYHPDRRIIQRERTAYFGEKAVMTSSRTRAKRSTARKALLGWLSSRRRHEENARPACCAFELNKNST